MGTTPPLCSNGRLPRNILISRSDFPCDKLQHANGVIVQLNTLFFHSAYRQHCLQLFHHSNWMVHIWCYLWPCTSVTVATTEGIQEYQVHARVMSILVIKLIQSKCVYYSDAETLSQLAYTCSHIAIVATQNLM